MKRILFLVILGLFFFNINLANSYYKSCYETYGFWAKENLDGTCSCSSGYHFGKDIFGKTKCIKNPTCSEIYGFGAKDNFDGTCSCRSGYVWGKDTFGKKKCIDGNSVCQDKFGIMASYNDYSGKCECSYGYELSRKSYGKGLECKSCTSKYGLHSSYNGLTKSCECDNGYTLKDGKCEEKTNSAYFFLKEYDDNENKAIVTSFYTHQDYLLELRFTSGLYKAENFVGKKIVINMGTDFDIDIYDKFILNDDLLSPYEVVTDILDVEEVESDFTLKTCEDIYGNNVEETYDNKCVCKTGYKWNYNKTSCIKQNDVYVYGNIEEFNKKECGKNSILNPLNKGKCICKVGYEWEKPNDETNLDCKKKEEIKLCGEHSKDDGNGSCICEEGYEWESEDENNLNCIKIEEKQSLIYRKKINKKLLVKLDKILPKILNKSEKDLIKLNKKIDLLLKKRLSIKTRDILLYLKYSIEEKIDENNDFKSLEDLLK